LRDKKYKNSEDNDNSIFVHNEFGKLIIKFSIPDNVLFCQILNNYDIFCDFVNIPRSHHHQNVAFFTFA
jgi:hypothetical protein